MTATGRASIEALVAPLAEAPAASAVLSDLDGTLAPIVADPAAVAVPDGIRALLAELCRRYAVVACVTGRRALEARRIVGVGELVYAGNHGLELLEPGRAEPVLAPGVAERADLARGFVAGLDRRGLAAAGLRVEDKGPIQALHWRDSADPELAAARADQVAAEARGAGLTPRAGRMVLEIRPRLPIDKGTAVAAVLAGRGVDRALFGGDDRTDLDAFAALAELERSGELRAAVSVGVDSDEAPADLAARCDILVAGTAGFREVLAVLAADG